MSETTCWYSENQRGDDYELIIECSLIKHNDWLCKNAQRTQQAHKNSDKQTKADL